MKKTELLHSGKSKSVYATDNPSQLILEFRDDATAFNGVKKSSLDRKGAVNNYFNAFIMQLLEKQGIPTHFIQRLSHTETLVKKVEIIPVECVIRNLIAGGLSKRLGIQEGTVPSQPIFECYLKSDPLDDPMINESHIQVFGWANENEIALMKKLSYRVNGILQPFFQEAGFLLVDYKLEFGRCEGNIILADEFSPDGARIWDKQTGEKYDKDRFRRDLGDVIEYYEKAAKRLNIPMPD